MTRLGKKMKDLVQEIACLELNRSTRLDREHQGSRHFATD
jgi:hypothetical protein